MYKWAKDDLEIKLYADHYKRVAYAEKSGLYCDLCGELISDDARTGRAADMEKAIRVDTVIPKIKLHSLAKSTEIDICPKCEMELLSKIAVHSDAVLGDLLSVTRLQVLDHEENEQRDRNHIRSLEKELNTMHSTLAALDKDHYDRL